MKQCEQNLNRFTVTIELYRIEEFFPILMRSK